MALAVQHHRLGARQRAGQRVKPFAQMRRAAAARWAKTPSNTAFEH